MTWVNDHGIQRWVGEFPEPSDAALEPYVVHLRHRRVCGDRRGTPGGSMRHYRAGEKACDECRLGAAEARKRAREKAKDKPCIDCGTLILRKSTRCNTCAVIHRNSRRTA